MIWLPGCHCCSARPYWTHRYIDVDGNLVWFDNIGDLYGTINLNWTPGGGTGLNPGRNGGVVYATTIDSSGNVIVAGTRVNNETMGVGSVFKYNSSGGLLWAFDHGGSVLGVSTDSSDNVYLIGTPVVDVGTTQTINYSSGAGDFILQYGWETTSALAITASAATIQAALEGLSTIGSGNVTVTGTMSPGGSISITFDSSVANASGDVLIALPRNSTGTNVDNRFTITALNNVTYARKLNSSGVEQWSSDLGAGIVAFTNFLTPAYDYPEFQTLGTQDNIALRPCCSTDSSGNTWFGIVDRQPTLFGGANMARRYNSSGTLLSSIATTTDRIQAIAAADGGDFYCVTATTTGGTKIKKYSGGAVSWTHTVSASYSPEAASISLDDRASPTLVFAGTDRTQTGFDALFRLTAAGVVDWSNDYDSFAAGDSDGRVSAAESGISSVGQLKSYEDSATETEEWTYEVPGINAWTVHCCTRRDGATVYGGTQGYKVV